MIGILRRSGLDAVGDVPWGTHFCQFYQTADELAEVLALFFRQGLEDNECCIHVASAPLEIADVQALLAKAVPDIEERIARGQIELLDHRQWFLSDGQFDPLRVLPAWLDKERMALARGFDGLRLSSNISWLPPRDWQAYSQYEEALTASSVRIA